MATVAQPEQLIESNLEVHGLLREARGEAGKRKVVLDLIVEGFGNQADGHYYSAALLDRVAQRFQGAKMFSDHLTREAEQKLGGLPRSWRDMVGRISRVWTDVNESGKRVIRGEADIFDDGLWRLLEQAVDVVGVSINARGTASPGTAEGRPARMVEDITQVKSVDVVAEAGAGGRILALVEAGIATAIQEGAQMSVRDETETASIDAALERDLNTEGAPATTQPADEATAPVTTAPPASPAATAEPTAPPAPAAAAPAAAPATAAAPASPAPAAPADAATVAASAEQTVPVSAVQAIAREAAQAVIQEQRGSRPGNPVGGLSRPLGAPPRWENDGYVEHSAEELWGPGDPINTRRSRSVRESDDQPEGTPGLPDEYEEEPEHIPGLPDDEDESTIEAYIEARARELAGARLYEAVREGLAVVREEYERRNTEALAEAERGFEKKLEQRDQRTLAASMIEGAKLPRASEQTLKAEFHDRFFEAGETALLEAVNTAIDGKKRELGQFAGARVTGGGATEVLTESHVERREVQRAPQRSGIDEGIERELG